MAYKSIVPLVTPKEAVTAAHNRPYTDMNIIIDLWNSIATISPPPKETATRFETNNYLLFTFHRFYIAGRMQGIKEERARNLKHRKDR